MLKQPLHPDRRYAVTNTKVTKLNNNVVGELNKLIQQIEKIEQEIALLLAESKLNKRRAINKTHKNRFP